MEPMHIPMKRLVSWDDDWWWCLVVQTLDRSLAGVRWIFERRCRLLVDWIFALKIERNETSELIDGGTWRILTSDGRFFF